MNLKPLVPDYLTHLNVLGRSPRTIRNAKYTLRQFIAFLQSEGIERIEDLDAEAIHAYQEELYFSLTAKGKPLALRTQSLRLSIVKGFTRYLTDEDYLVHDPSTGIVLPKKPKRLPKVILSPKEVKKLLNAPDMRTHKGYRNRVVLELLYDTGIRRAEMAGIRIRDMDLKAGFIHITGKGDKDRVVPLCSRVCDLVVSYIRMVRPLLFQDKDPGFLIVNRWGKRMSPDGIWAVVVRCASLSGIRKNITPHTLRHTCATHMLKNGASTRHLQQMLGHESLESTQVYTHVTINDLKEIHSRYHPLETL